MITIVAEANTPVVSAAPRKIKPTVGWAPLAHADRAGAPVARALGVEAREHGRPQFRFTGACAPASVQYLAPAERLPRLPYPVRSAGSLVESVALGLIGGTALLAIIYGFSDTFGLVANWGVFQAGIEKLIW